MHGASKLHSEENRSLKSTFMRGWVCGSVTECLHSMWEALDSFKKGGAPLCHEFEDQISLENSHPCGQAKKRHFITKSYKNEVIRLKHKNSLKNAPSFTKIVIISDNIQIQKAGTPSSIYSIGFKVLWGTHIKALTSSRKKVMSFSQCFFPKDVSKLDAPK